MCGIFGFTASKNKSFLEKMKISLRHRGPDAQDYWESDECSMGLDRLAVLDIRGGQQPCFCKTVTSVMNGEIYNYKELRKELMGLGYRFKSDHSDAELIPAVYLEWGLDFINHLDGMFAVALWDAESKKLILARDAMGKKPCYYAIRDGGVYFASEIKALISIGFGTEISDDALISFLAKKSVESPLSIYTDIVQVPPATIAVFENGILKQTNKYWTPKFDGNLLLASEEEYVELIAAELLRSVKIRCNMDVEFGSFLSGGLDSSLVSTLAAAHTNKRLKTFTLTYEDSIAGKNEDERFAAMIAEKIGADRYVYRLGHEEVWNSIPAVLASFDEPFSATISPYFLCSLVSKHVKVALCGDGADELFGSYMTHRRSADMDSHGEGSLDNIVWRQSLAVFSDTELSQMLSRQVKTTKPKTGGLHATTQLHKTLEGEFCDQLPNQVLKYADRLSMAHSVEIRSPFLDKNFVELVGHIPSNLKIKESEVKYILKKAALKFLPEELVFRPKEGFVLPVWKWMDSVWKDRIKKILLESDMADDFGIQKTYVTKLLREWDLGIPHHAKIWNLLMLSIWNQGKKCS
jgi:asparagine synthase (glutamine-hydrolysing)